MPSQGSSRPAENAGNFYWYDLETSGKEPRWDRIVQFAGLRTDGELNEIGDQFSAYIRLPDDVLPDVDATLVTGITPQLASEKGMGEWQALRRINSLFSAPGTCVAGYNNLRFDDEFIRHGLYRNFMDPYAREWRNGNSRWDILDLVRAARALRPEGIEWPADEDGLPVYRLAALTAANGLEHGQPHDALCDVRATLALARLIRAKQPKLFRYHHERRAKKQAQRLLHPFGARICIHVSGMYPRKRFGCAPVASIGRHPENSNSIIVVDLGADIDMLLDWPAERLREALFEPEAPERPPLKEVRINKCPFLAPADVVSPADAQRLGFDPALAEQRRRRLSKSGIAEKLQQLYARGAPAPAPDADAALYDGFLLDEDRARCETFAGQLEEGRWLDLDYRDQRLHVLADRLKARGFPERQSPEERTQWRLWVQAKLGAEEAPWRTLQAFQRRLAEGPAEDDQGTERQTLQALQAHAKALKMAYAL